MQQELTPVVQRHELDSLGWEAFEALVQSLLKARLGMGVEAWGGRGDWGRDAYFKGRLAYPSKKTVEGRFLFQCKFVEGANAAGANPRNAILDAIGKECRKIRSSPGKYRDVTVYGLFTNAPLRPEWRVEIEAKLKSAFPCTQICLHSGSDVCGWLRLSPEITSGFRETEFYQRLRQGGLHTVAERLRLPASRSVVQRASRFDDQTRSRSALFDLEMLLCLRDRRLTSKEQGILMPLVLEVMQDDRHPSFVRHRALILASQLALSVPDFPWFNHCGRIRAWVNAPAQQGLGLGDHWLLALTTLTGSQNLREQLQTAYTRHSQAYPFDSRAMEHAALNLAEGLRSLLVCASQSARRALPPAERIQLVLSWIDLGFVARKTKGASEFRLLLLCCNLINVAKVLRSSSTHKDIVPSVQKKIHRAGAAMNRQMRILERKTQAVADESVVPPWHYEATFMHDEEFWRKGDGDRLSGLLLEIYEAAVENRQPNEYSQPGWISWLDYFKSIGITSMCKPLGEISRRAVGKCHPAISQ